MPVWAVILVAVLGSGGFASALVARIKSPSAKRVEDANAALSIAQGSAELVEMLRTEVRENRREIGEVIITNKGLKVQLQVCLDSKDAQAAHIAAQTVEMAKLSAKLELLAASVLQLSPPS